MNLLTDFQSFSRNLTCVSNAQLSGLYTVFMYDGEDHLTAYHEDMKQEYYMSIAEFKSLFTKTQP
jgi:hypothetical protein